MLQLGALLPSYVPTVYRMTLFYLPAGGLEALAGMLEHPNLYLRGQVVDALHQLSGGDLQAKAASTGGFDWWDTASSTSSTESSKMALHAKMLALRECEAWLPGLVANAEPSNSYPGDDD